MANPTNPSDRWYFTKEQLENTPSRKCGFDAHKELSNRQQAANFIQDMGQRLKVSQLCINTAIVYMHRFYVFHSFTHFPWHQMAAAALFLAAKVEEQPRKLEYVIRVANICKNSRDTTIDINSERYIAQSQDLVFNENVLLQTLGFDVAIDHPHTHVVRCCHLVRASKDLAQTSYFMASNSLHLTTMCIQYKPTVVACFCILVACKWSNWEIPLSYEKKEWYSYVDPSVTAELLQQLTEEFLVIFEKCPSRLKEKIMAIADNVSHIPSHHIISPFDDPKKKHQPEEGKDGHSHRSSGSDNDPHKHRSSRPHEMGTTSSSSSTGNSTQHHRERDRERERRERQQQQQKAIVGSGSSSSSNSAGGNSSSMKSSSHHSSSSGHHRPERPPMDPKMKPPSRPHSMPYPQPKDILREAATRDSPFGLARDSNRDYTKEPHLARSDNKDPNKRDYQYKNNNQNPDMNNTNSYSDARLNYSSEKQRLDSNGRSRVDPNKLTSNTSRNRQDESKSHLENIKKHLSAAPQDKNSSYLNKPVAGNEIPKSVPKTNVTPVNSNNNVKVTNTNSGTYAPPINSDIKPKIEPIVVKEEVPTPHVIKRPSLFSPEKTPPQKYSVPNNTATDNIMSFVSPLTSPVAIKRERNYSSSSEPELRPVMKKIDQVEGFETLMRDNTIGIDKDRQTPDHINKIIEDNNAVNVQDIKQQIESNGDDSTANNSRLPSLPQPTVNGLVSTDPTVISNLLKEASTVSHLPPVIKTEIVTEAQTDKNHYHHKSKKKNKDKHKHKDKNREDKEKKKKHKDKEREKHRHREKVPEVTPTPAIEPLVLKIQKDKIIRDSPSQGLKIKIPKNKINTENISELSHNAAPIVAPITEGIKLKIPKDKLNNCPNLDSSMSRKRERDRKDRISPDGPPAKVSKSSIKEAKTNGKYSNNNKVSPPNVVNNNQIVQQQMNQQNIVINQQQESTNNYQKMFSTPPPPPPPPLPPIPLQNPAHTQMYYYDRMPPLPMPNLNVPPPSYNMYNYYNQNYMYQGAGMYNHPPMMHGPPLMHNNNSIPPLPMDAPPQLPPPPPE
ncbi:cyclin-T isoform X1 [Diorhabda sublineata]|uniref:cyclin-T isoform X1 n=1 Tax=Diorhabda sublineata TaxID=1163346 RepID=UPI0024E18B30|nr:cyclin-T isoform X1 [Diorhabda sublineata]